MTELLMHTPHNELRPGDRVELVEVVDNYPTIWAEVGLRGTVTETTNGDAVWVRLDRHFDSLKEWENELQVWSETHPEALKRVQETQP